MGRLRGFDYKSPYFYMVTLKRLKGLAAFSEIGPNGLVENAITRAGGGLVVLSPEGFGPRWHPPREKERFCAAGCMLFLSLYEATARQPTRKELYDRCHEMVDLAQAGLQA